jgi:hypothetical protein
MSCKMHEEAGCKNREIAKDQKNEYKLWLDTEPDRVLLNFKEYH